MPFHLVGGGPYPSSLKLADSGQIPVSSIPTIMSLSVVVLLASTGKPMKSHDLVVRSFFFPFGNTDTTPSMPGYTKLQSGWQTNIGQFKIIYNSPTGQFLRLLLRQLCNKPVEAPLVAMEKIFRRTTVECNPLEKLGHYKIFILGKFSSVCFLFLDHNPCVYDVLFHLKFHVFPQTFFLKIFSPCSSDGKLCIDSTIVQV